MVPGLIYITIKNTASSVVTTLLACGGVVVKSRTSQVAPSQQVIDDWTNQISAELQQFETVMQQVDIATVAQTKSYLGIS
jgi:hypothetical protein